MNSLALPIVHPAFQNLRRSGRLLHLTAAGLILAHAISHFINNDSASVYFWCQVLVAADIIILVFAGRQFLDDMPKVNLFFRIIEVLFFAGIAATVAMKGNWWSAGMHLFLAAFFFYLFYCEKRAVRNEYIGIHHTGVNIPLLAEDRFLAWSHIRDIEARYDCIRINTSFDKSYQFDLRKNLEFEELEQIHEFCRHYLGESSYG